MNARRDGKGTLIDLDAAGLSRDAVIGAAALSISELGMPMGDHGRRAETAATCVAGMLAEVFSQVVGMPKPPARGVTYGDCHGGGSGGSGGSNGSGGSDGSDGSGDDGGGGGGGSGSGGGDLFVTQAEQQRRREQRQQTTQLPSGQSSAGSYVGNEQAEPAMNGGFGLMLESNRLLVADSGRSTAGCA